MWIVTCRGEKRKNHSQIRVTGPLGGLSAKMPTMAFIEYVRADEWRLDPDNILRIHGINPPVLKAHLALYRAVMHGPSPLTRIQREMMAVVVSADNQCHY